MILAPVMVLARVIVLSCVMVLALVMVLARVIVLELSPCYGLICAKRISFSKPLSRETCEECSNVM